MDTKTRAKTLVFCMKLLIIYLTEAVNIAKIKNIKNSIEVRST